jgi:hypothetical protein
MLTANVDDCGIRLTYAAPSVPAMKDLNVRLAVVLGLAALVRPVLSIVGAYDSGPLGKPVGPVLLTALICVGWVAAAVLRRTPNPVATLGLAGLTYGVAAILLNLSLQPFLASAETIPAPGYVAIPVVNVVQGVVLGAVAWLVLRLARRRTG